MTTRPRLAPKPIDDIKTDLQSPSTTTSQTLSLLRSALNLNLENDNKQTLPVSQDRKNVPRINHRKPVTGAPKRPATMKTSTVAIHEDAVPAAVTLDAKARRALATETFNITLKSLSNAANSRHKNGAGIPQRKPKMSSNPPKPLKQTSPNRQPKFGRGECTGKDEPHLEATADCANLALDFLRSFQCNDQQRNAVDLRLEQGALILLDKTITLELLPQAEHQLRKLYEKYWKRRKSGDSDISASLSENAFFDVDVESEKSAFKLATALQGYWLRVAILKGSQSMSERMVDGMRLETTGSPSSVIIEGHKLGHMDAEACGTQLRTISLALSRLQSLSSVKTVSSRINPASALRLATIALQIKMHSWKYLGHQPDLQKELWAPMNRHFQRYKTMIASETAQDAIKSCMKTLQETLVTLEFDTSPPQVIKDFLGRCLVQTGDDQDPVQQTFAKLNGAKDTLRSLLLILDSTIVRLDAYPEQLEHADQSLEQLRIYLDQQKSLSRSEVTMIFQKVARVRKSVMTTCSLIENEAAKGNISQAYLQLQVSCIRTIYTFVAFTVRCLQHPPSSNPKPGKHANTDPAEENLLLTYARIIEAVSLTEQLPITRTAVLSEEGMAALSRALEIANSITSTNITSATPPSTRLFFEGIPVRISQAFWSRFLWLTEHRRPISDCLHALESSIDAVERRSLSERQAALLILKYERMAALLEKSKLYPKVQNALEKALELALEVGLLNDAVEAYLFRSTENVWSDTKSAFYRFGINLDSYAKLSVGNCALHQHLWMFDVETQPSLHRFVMLERQLVSILKSSVSFSKERLKIAIDHILGLLRQPNLKQHQLQFVSQLLFLLERDKRWNARDFVTNEEIRSMICSTEDVPSEGSEPVIAMLRHIISTQWALVTGELDEDLLRHVATEYKNSFETIADPRIFQNSNRNTTVLASQLTTLSDFAGVLGNDTIQLELLMMLRMLQQHDQSQSHDQKVSCLVQIGVLQNRLNNTALAGKAFAQSEKLLPKKEILSQHRIAWALSYAEYLFNVRSASKSQELLQVAQENNAALDDNHESQSRFKLERKTALCQAAYLSSKLAFKQGQLSEALPFAKQAARLSIGVWNSIEKTLQALPSDKPEDSLQNITNNLSNMSLSSEQAKPAITQGARFWNIISLHRQVLRHIAILFSHAGLYEDSLFYSQHVWRVCQVTGCKTLSASVRADLALIYANAAQSEKALQLLSCEEIEGSGELRSSDSLGFLLVTGEACALLGKFDEAGIWLQRIHDLQLPWLRSNVSRSATPELGRHVSPNKKAVKPRNFGTGKRAIKTAIPVSLEKPVESSSPLTVFQLEVLARVLTLRNTISQFEHSDSRQANVELSLSTSAARSPLSTVSAGLMLLRQALKTLTTDPASNALAETAVAIPVRYRPTRKSGQMSLLLDDTAMSTPKITKPAKTPKIADITFELDIPTADGSQLLRGAFEMLQAVDASKNRLLPSSTVTVMYKALCQITLMSSALSVPMSYSTLGMVLQSLIPKEISRSREKDAIQAETTALTPEELQTWPQLSVQPHEGPSEHFRTDLKEFLNVLPSTWTIVSLGLNHDRKELLLSKMESGTSPFLMRVPLGRPDIDDSEAHDFTFEYAKGELLEIINATTVSTHDERGQGDKQTRAKWYAEREALDHRLKALLVNIEIIWLGGFRGLLASQLIDQTLLSRFGQSFSNSLDAHLPSRQKASKTTTRVDLHAHVLELFVTLPFSESPELEDSVTDLLYFVTDILQINGEPNAYDEIDFDALLVDVLDALRAYHATKSNSSDQPARHTILIIDKELEAFPWESLPILHHRPVSRMPSLSSIKDRLALIRQQSPNASALTIPASQGAYILNPSSDLPSTQATFQSLLSNNLPTYTSLIAQPPTTQQFESFLTQNPLVLYFGHGSGAQYIPKRRIRNLKSCAVTWLLGCSSAKMTEAGNFENYGMPNSYIHGGSPAVVGTLWDVTDRDLDRAGLRGLEAWGLLDLEDGTSTGKGESAKGGKRNGKPPKGKEKTRTITGKVQGEGDAEGGLWNRYKTMPKEERRGKVAIDEALSMAREACWLRYLNGAALVVYGVPVVVG